MEIILRCCAGLDVHKDSVEACVRRLSGGGKVEHEVRHWETTTRALVEMAEWLCSSGVTHVAMESTGVYWKPIFNILEAQFEILLVNAHHMKNVPGRKTDIRDCQWIAQLLQHGLLKGSFIPPRPQRELRDLTRQRTQMVDEPYLEPYPEGAGGRQHKAWLRGQQRGWRIRTVDAGGHHRRTG